jgi:aminopeptidase
MPELTQDTLHRYAELLIHTGVNLQPDQGLVISAEHAHADFVRTVAAVAYRAGAKYVHVDWIDLLLQRAALQNRAVEQLDYPAYEVARFRQFTDEGWARLALDGQEFPHALDDVDPAAIRNWGVKRLRATRFYRDAMMSNQMQWCVAAVPTVAWAQQIFPHLDAGAGVAALWATILRLVRMDASDPITAWAEHNRRLKNAAAYLHRHQVRAVRFFDPTPGPDGLPATDLTVGLAEQAHWMGGDSTTPAGVHFQPNMPTEEIFSAPHRARVDGYVRTTRPSFPMQREVDDAWFRFADGKVVDFHARVGQDVIEQFLTIEGADRLGEVALVDSASPVFQSGLLFKSILFDENAACHIAFGEAYPECVEGGDALTREELAAKGVNQAETHVDFMIGAATMNVTGLCADGSETPIMVDGRFAPAVVNG